MGEGGYLASVELGKLQDCRERRSPGVRFLGANKMDHRFSGLNTASDIANIRCKKHHWIWAGRFTQVGHLFRSGYLEATQRFEVGLQSFAARSVRQRGGQR